MGICLSKLNFGKNQNKTESPRHNDISSACETLDHLDPSDRRPFVPSTLIRERKCDISEVYEVSDRFLGAGSFGHVCVATEKSSGIQRALKIIPKRNDEVISKARREIRIMKLLDHPNIVKIYDTFETENEISLVLELCEGGELFDRINEYGSFCERDTMTIMDQILRCVSYVHLLDIIHRDLKPENFLFLQKGDISTVPLKLIDFGLATPVILSQNSQSNMDEKKEDTIRLTRKRDLTRAGTPYYVAPEVLTGYYTQSCDLWSCGVIMYTLICGYPPFRGKNCQEIMKRASRGRPSYDEPGWSRISENARDLLRRLLSLDPRKRITAADAVNHKWFFESRKFPSLTYSLVDTSKCVTGLGILNRLRNFRDLNELQRISLHILAVRLRELTINGMELLRSSFVEIDIDKDGRINKSDLAVFCLGKHASLKYPLDYEEIGKMLWDLSVTGKSELVYSDFIASSLMREQGLEAVPLSIPFEILDHDRDGLITWEDICSFLSPESAQKEKTGSTLTRGTTETLRGIIGPGIDLQNFVSNLMTGFSATPFPLRGG